MFLHRQRARSTPHGAQPPPQTFATPPPPAPSHLPKLSRGGPGLANRMSGTIPIFAGGKQILLLGRRKPSVAQSTVSPVLTQTIVVRILSNWGNPNYVSVSEVALLNARKQQVEVITSSVIPREAGADRLSKLTDGDVMKTSPDQCWRAPIPPGGVIEITFCTAASDDLQFVRVFNCPVLGDTAVKSIEVWREDSMLWKGDIDREFGLVAPIGKVLVQRPREIPVVREPARDKYGLVPQTDVSRLQIEFFSNYGCGNLYGLSGIEIMDADGERITADRVSSVRPLNGDAREHGRVLFRGDYETPQLDKMWTIEKTGDGLPGLDIEFTEPFYIGRIRFWNIYSPEHPIAAGCQRTRIKIGGRVVWVGKLRQGDGEQRNLSKSVTTVVLGDLNHRLARHM